MSCESTNRLGTNYFLSWYKFWTQYSKISVGVCRELNVFLYITYAYSKRDNFNFVIADLNIDTRELKCYLHIKELNIQELIAIYTTPLNDPLRPKSRW